MLAYTAFHDGSLVGGLEGVSMNGVDLVILVILLIGIVGGLARGFVRGLLGLVGLALGVLLAAAHHGWVANTLLGFIPGERASAVVAFILIFIAVVVVVGLIAVAITKALRLVALGWLDRLAGGALGLLMSAIVAGLLLLLAVMAGFDENEAIVQSRLAPRVFRVTDAIVSMVPSEARETFEDGYLKLRLRWERAQSRRERLVHSVELRSGEDPESRSRGGTSI
ncbi:MAG: hypothetical protein GF405_07855 [Candidatus Eisenbacteria bacterium]|nr:hypothetical protein [Candidatus Eisenbacteria bacterium]